MITLDRIILREIQLPLREPFRISSGEMRERRILLLELFDKDGAHTWAESVVDDLPNYSSETLDTAWPTIVRVLAPRLLGRRIDGPGAVHAILEQDVRGHNMAKAALEMGCWGLAAEQAKLPLARAHRHRHLARHSARCARAHRQSERSARRGVSEGEDQDRTGP
jgi:O-succinylbenzoate synthase